MQVIIYFLQNWKEMSFPLAQLLIFFVVAGTDIGTAIYYRYVLDKVQSIGYVAHFAGKLVFCLLCTLWGLVKHYGVY